LLYVADTYNHVIRAIVLATRNTSILAGSNIGVAGWADGAGTAARFNHPRMCAVDTGNANMYVTDENNGAIRKISLASISHDVTTIIGSSCTSNSADCAAGKGDGCCWPGLLLSPCTDDGCYHVGAGTSASLIFAQSLVLSVYSPCDNTAGCLWVTSQLGVLSVVDLSASPPVMTLAACIDPAGTSCTSCTTSSGCTAYPSTQLQGVALDGASPPNLLVALRSSYGIWQCAPGGSLSVLASCTRDVGQGVGYKYVEGTSAGSTTSEGTIGSWADELTNAPLSAGIINPWGLAFDATAASLFIADQNVVRFSNFVSGLPGNVVTVAGGKTVTLPGKGTLAHPQHWFSPGPTNKQVPNSGYFDGVGTTTAFNAPNNVVAVPSTRMLYIADAANDCIRSMRY
jgi:hypothetical protein